MDPTPDVDAAVVQATKALGAVDDARAQAWAAVQAAATATGCAPGDLFGHKVNIDALQKGPPTTALPVLVKAATAWKRHLEGGYTWRRRDRTKRRRGAASNLVSIVDDGLGPSAFAHLILGSGFCAPSDLGRLSRVAACFGSRRPHGIAGQRPWLSLAEASCRVLAQNHLRRMLKPAVAVLPIGRACGKAFGSRRLEEAVKARNGPLNRWRARLKVGDRLDVMDNDARRAKRGDLGRWCEAVLVGCTEKNDRKWWTVHFRGWDTRFDEEIDADHAERFLPPYSSVEDWRTNLNEGDEIEVRRPGDHGDARTYWFQGRVVSVAKDEIFVRMQVLDPSVQQLEPWPVARDSERIAAKHEHIKREVWLTLN